MKRILLALTLLATPAIAQVDFDGSGGATIQNPISNTIISTTDMLRVYGRISSTAPIVSGAMVYKTNTGLVQTASNTYVANPGAANESLIAVNVNANVLNVSSTLNATVLKLVSPTAMPACNTSTVLQVVPTSSGKLCVCNGTAYINLLGGTNLITGLLTGTCP